MAAPGRTARMTRLTPGELYRRHVQRKKMIALIAGLLLLPVSLVMIASFDDGPLGQAAQSLGLGSGGLPAQPTLVGYLPTATMPPSIISPLPTATIASPLPTLTPPAGISPLPTPTLFQPPRQTPLPTSTSTPAATPTATGTPMATLFQPPRQTPLPTSTASGAGAGGTPTAAPTQSASSPAPAGTPVSTPPSTLPVTGMPATAFPGQAIGFVLLAISLILIAAGPWPVNEDSW